MILPVRTSESIQATLPLGTATRTSGEDYLAGRMAAHGITGSTSALTALLEELGVDVEKLKAA